MDTKPQQDLATRKRDRWLWGWPVILITAMAVLGQWQGPFGVLAAGVGITGVLTLYQGYTVFTKRLHITVFVVVCVLATGVFVGASYGVISHRPSDAASESSVPSREFPSVDQLRSGRARGAALNGIVLDRQPLRDAQLQGIIAPGASMEDTVLENAKLTGADLRGANLHGAHLHDADLRGANLAGADLGDADLTDACLRGANLAGATIIGVEAEGAAVEDVVVSSKQIRQADAWPSGPPATPASCPN